MRAVRVKASQAELLNPAADIWRNQDQTTVELLPAPLAMVAERSPFLAKSEGHGVITKVGVSAVHNGELLALRLRWADEARDDKLTNLDKFVDGAAILFPLSPQTVAMTMGSETAPANGWYWKANQTEPFDVLSKGFGNTVRRPGSFSLLKSASTHDGKSWTVVMQRPLAVKSADLVRFQPGKTTGIAVAVWEGSNNERSGRKSMSGDFIDLELQK